MSDVVAAASESWYGHGRWSAPFWFIGPEPGMKKREGENLVARCQAWLDLGLQSYWIAWSIIEPSDAWNTTRGQFE